MAAPSVALAPFLRSCPSVLTLGIRPTMDDYSDEERDLMRQAPRVYFPSTRYVTVFQAIGKPTFPSPATYRFRRSRLQQQILFKVLEIPHPRARIYFGKRQKERMRSEFRLPVAIMGPHAHPGSVHLAADWPDAARYASRYNPTIVREARPIHDLVRLTCVCFRCIGATRTSVEEGTLATPRGSAMDDPSFSVPIRETEKIARQVGLDDIAFDWASIDGRWQLLQIVRPPLRIQTPGHTLCRHDYICDLIQAGAL